MADILNDDKLYIALSELFIDNEVNYNYIASIAKSFPIEHVEYALFYYVGPVCYQNLLSPVPPIWTFFDEETLIADINHIKKNENRMINKIKMNILAKRLRLEYKSEWEIIKNLIS